MTLSTELQTHAQTLLSQLLALREAGVQMEQLLAAVAEPFPGDDRQNRIEDAPLGFHAGLNPPRKSLGGMHELTALVLRAFAEPQAPATLIAARTATVATPAATLTAPGGTAR